MFLKGKVVVQDLLYELHSFKPSNKLSPLHFFFILLGLEP